MRNGARTSARSFPLAGSPSTALTTTVGRPPREATAASFSSGWEACSAPPGQAALLGERDQLATEPRRDVVALEMGFENGRVCRSAEPREQAWQATGRGNEAVGGGAHPSPAPPLTGAAWTVPVTLRVAPSIRSRIVRRSVEPGDVTSATTRFPWSPTTTPW